MRSRVSRCLREEKKTEGAWENESSEEEEEISGGGGGGFMINTG